MQECEASENAGAHERDPAARYLYQAKRKSVFLSQEYEKLPQQELRLTIDELVRAMNSCEVECGVVYLTTKPIASKEVERLFELLKTIMEMTISELHSLFISVSDQEMNLSVECMIDLSEIASAEVMVCREDGLWLIRTLIGGEANA